MKSTILLAIVGLILIGLGTFSIRIGEYAYTGKVVFNSESDVSYTEFKELLADEEVKIIRLEKLASSPVIVQFKVVTPHDSFFPYGDKTNLGMGLFIIFTVFGGGFIITSIISQTKWWNTGEVIK